MATLLSVLVVTLVEEVRTEKAVVDMGVVQGVGVVLIEGTIERVVRVVFIVVGCVEIVIIEVLEIVPLPIVLVVVLVVVALVKSIVLKRVTLEVLVQK